MNPFANEHNGDVHLLHVRIPRDLVRQLDHLARARERSLSGEVRLAIRRHVERPAEPAEAAELVKN